MAKPKATKQAVRPDESQMIELVSHLPGKNPPYLKSFRDEKPPRMISDSKLIYTACSSKKWLAPESREPKRAFA